MILTLEKVPPEGLELERALELPDLPQEGLEPIRVSDLHLHADASRVARGVELEGSFSAQLTLVCVRCLEPVEMSLSRKLRLIFLAELPDPGRPDAEPDPEAAFWYHAEGGLVDLRAVLEEQIYLHLPLKPLCGADCRGLCPTCGGNRNRIECGCRSGEVDPRLAALAEWKKRLGGH